MRFVTVLTGSFSILILCFFGNIGLTENAEALVLLGSLIGNALFCYKFGQAVIQNAISQYQDFLMQLAPLSNKVL